MFLDSSISKCLYERLEYQSGFSIFTHPLLDLLKEEEVNTPQLPFLLDLIGPGFARILVSHINVEI